MNLLQSRLDLQRRNRLGMVEAIWGEHKSTKQIIEILTNGIKNHGKAEEMITRIIKTSFLIE